MSRIFGFLIALLAGRMNKRQQLVVEYLVSENQTLREKLGGKRIQFTDAQRIRLARAAKPIGRKGLSEIATLVSPDTLLRWHRKLIAEKWTHPPHSEKRSPGRPAIAKETCQLIVRLAEENSSWGYRRICGALKSLGISVCPQTVANVLQEHGMDPAPLRKKRTRWRDFINRHRDVMWGADFFTTEIWSQGRLTTFYVLLFIEIATRKVVLGGITTNPNDQWMTQTARELTGCDDPLYHGESKKRLFLLRDRDAKYTDSFDRILRQEGFRILKLPPRSPNLNAFAERFVRTIKEECLYHLILFGERSLRRAVREFIEHYHEERPHQGLENVIPFPTVVSGKTPPPDNLISHKVRKSSRLGGLLNFYRLATERNSTKSPSNRDSFVPA